MATPCQCPACGLRRLAPALSLIALGALLLAHMLRPSFNAVAVVAGFLVFLGALGIARHLAPGPRPAPDLPAPYHPAPGSLFFPFLLLAVGLLILLRHSLPNLPLGAWIAHYWPLLLILWGLTRLVEHYTRPPRARGGLSGGEIVLLFFIILFGLAFSGAYRFRHSRLANYWGVNVDNWNPFYQSYSFAASTQAPPPPGPPPTILIRGYRGDIVLLPGPPGAISASLADTVHADGQDEANRLFQASQPRIEQDGAQWVVAPAGDARPPNLRADLKLTLPPSVPVAVQTELGDVSASHWAADLDLRTAHGDITLDHIHANVQIASGHDSLRLDHIAGNVTITGTATGDNVSLANVSGDATLNGEFTGTLRFRNLARGLHFNSRRTSLAIAALPGSLDYDLGRIAIANAQSISLRTRNEAISIRQFSGPLQVHSRDDRIALAAAAPPTDPILVTNQNADISLTLPAQSQFHLQATLRNGDLHNEFSPAASSAPAPAIRLETSSGDIAVRKQ